MSRGMQPVNLEVITQARYRERRELLEVFQEDNHLSPAEHAMLDRFDEGTATHEEAVQCIWIGMAWLRTMSPEPEQRTRVRDLEREYQQTYGPLPVALAAD